MSLEFRDGQPVIVMRHDDKRLQLSTWDKEGVGMILNADERDAWLAWEKESHDSSS